MHTFETIQQLADDALIQGLTHSVKGDRQLAARMLFEMGELEARGLFRDLGCFSMFEYATKKLGMSESEAGLRLRVVSSVARCPPHSSRLHAVR